MGNYTHTFQNISLDISISAGSHDFLCIKNTCLDHSKNTINTINCRRDSRLPKHRQRTLLCKCIDSLASEDYDNSNSNPDFRNMYYILNCSLNYFIIFSYLHKLINSNQNIHRYKDTYWNQEICHAWTFQQFHKLGNNFHHLHMSCRKDGILKLNLPNLFTYACGINKIVKISILARAFTNIELSDLSKIC